MDGFGQDAAEDGRALRYNAVYSVPALIAYAFVRDRREGRSVLGDWGIARRVYELKV